MLATYLGKEKSLQKFEIFLVIYKRLQQSRTSLIIWQLEYSHSQ